MKRIFVASILLCLSYQATGAPLSFFPINSGPTELYMAAGLGPMFYNVRGDNHLDTGAGWPNDTYNVNDISNQVFGFIEMGNSWQRAETWLPRYSFGARLMYVPNTDISGTIDQYSLPEFRNYNYSYDVNMLSLLAILKANIYRWQNWMPYIILGAGVTTYATSNYSEQALGDVTPRVSPAFGDGSGTNFTYQIGIGIDYALRQNLLINFDVNYINFGTVNTGKGANYATLTGTNYDNESLKNNIDATSLVLGVTYYLS